jgi:hypothetical protein
VQQGNIIGITTEQQIGRLGHDSRLRISFLQKGA